jgi:gamma-glutamyl-gamma-aminobutyrate hydrolase PuuD
MKLDQGEKNVVGQPVIGFPWNLESPGGAASKLNVHLKQQPSLPLKYDFLPDEIATNDLQEEIQKLIHEIGSSVKEGSSIAKEVLKLAKEKIVQGNGPVQIAKILGMAKSLVRHSDGIVLPGGADIQPIFYGHTPHELLKPDPDFRRSLIEFAILNEAEVQGKPVLGICRGSQLANVWYGGTMTQHIEGNIFKTKEYRVLEKKKDAAFGTIREIVGKDGSLLGFAVHHQEYAKIGSALEEVIEKRALEQKFGSPQIYVQWHPEFKGDTTTEEARLIDAGLSEENVNFFKVFVDAANVRRKMKAVTSEIPPEISRPK